MYILLLSVNSLDDFKVLSFSPSVATTSLFRVIYKFSPYLSSRFFVLRPRKTIGRNNSEGKEKKVTECGSVIRLQREPSITVKSGGITLSYVILTEAIAG